MLSLLGVLGGYRYHGLHLDLQRVARLRSFRHGESANIIYFGDPPPSPALKLLDHPRGTDCSARNDFDRTKPETTLTRGGEDELPWVSTVL